MSSVKTAPMMPSTAPPPSATTSAASCARTGPSAGPAAAATTARDASGSATSMDLVMNATAGTSIAALQSSPSASGVDAAAPTAISAP